MIALGKSKFIQGDQHHFYYIEDNEDWSSIPWFYKECENQYWIPVKMQQLKAQLRI